MGNFHIDFHYFALLFIIFSIHTTGSRSASVFNVQTYDAVGDGVKDDTQAFIKAWTAACKVSSATLLVPGSKKFVVSNSVFKGPCAPGFIFQVDGSIVALANLKIWKDKTVWLQFQTLDQFTLKGSGTIDGEGSNWWSSDCHKNKGKKYCKQDNRPTAIHFNGCHHVTIQGLSVVNSPKIHISFTGSDNVGINSVKIRAPESSPNTDGIDINRGSDIRIISCDIGTGDDCIAIGSGSSNIYIKDLKCGPGHGISVGSLGKGNSEAYVSTVHVDGADLTATTNGLRIKTWQGGAGSVDSIVFQNVNMVNVSNPIIIDQYYCDSQKPCANQTSAVRINNVIYNGISGTSATPAAVKLACSESVPCTGIRMSDIDLIMSSGDQATCFCENVHLETSDSVNTPNCPSS